jgi:hypothetical protein
MTQLVNRAFLKPVVCANRHLRGVAYPSLIFFLVSTLLYVLQLYYGNARRSHTLHSCIVPL